MFSARSLTTDFAVTGQLCEIDFQAAADAGFRTIFNFRPDSETAGQLPASAAEKAARAAGLGFVHLPATKFSLFADALVGQTVQALRSAQGPILAYCASGQRAAILWAAASARAIAVDDILAALHNAGFDLSFLRDDLEAQADRARWDAVSPQPEKQLVPTPSLVAA